MEIYSRENKEIKSLLKLKDKKYRDIEGKFVIEGERFISEIPDSLGIDKLFLSRSSIEKISLGEGRYKVSGKEITLGKDVSNVFILEDRLFSQISDTKTPQGILAVCRKLNYDICNFFAPKKDLLLVVADRINDPGNLGTLIRNCAAFDVDGLILSSGSVDLYNPKVLRASAGNIFKVKIATDCNLVEFLPKLKENHIKIFATDLSARATCFDANFKSSMAIIIGNEANGVGKDILNMSDEIIKIPMAEGVESLNISIASGILLYETYRQRLNR